MRKLFIAALALGAMVACNNGMEEVATTPATGNEVAKLAVSLQTVTTRAYSYTNGLPAESEVKSIDFYLFADGAAYNGGANRVEVNMEKIGDWKPGTEGNNITKTSDIILVIAKEKNKVPTHIVALLNATEDYSDLSLTDLQAEVAENLVTDNGFVMSNSVYDSETNTGVVVATEIKPENIFVDAKSNDTAGTAYTGELEVKPVKIYVERVAAKVKVSSNVVNNNGFIPVKDAEGKAISNTFIKVLGWEITNATSSSYLLKSYATSSSYLLKSYATSYAALNNLDAFRSHWATTYPQTVGHTFTFGEIADLDADGEVKASSDALQLGGYQYYHENTLTATNAEGWFNDVNDVTSKEGYNGGATKSPQLIVAAQLVDADGKAKEFGTWYGETYNDVAGLKAAMINNAAKQIFVIESTDNPETEDVVEPTVYRSINVEDVDFYQVADDTSYKAEDWNGDFRHEVRVKAYANKTYFTANKDENGNLIAFTSNDKVTDILQETEPAMIWTSGYTYYYTLINHYQVNQTQLYGMVRNHVYEVNITGVTGYGTPVYEPLEHIITPEPPKKQDGFSLTAEINVLSWAVVNQNVNLGN